MRRSKMSKSENRRNFRRGAGHHPANMAQAPMRGGWRL